jgi:hypothetical protein|tara:strand:- start:627 stop:935 length:309 start_codon:yes stop_codon:yes gene_type:complete
MCNTFTTFLIENETKFKQQPVPLLPQEYYGDGNLCVFDEFKTIVYCQDQDGRRQLVCDTLHDAFVNVRDAELEHLNNMKYLQQRKVLSTANNEPEDECELIP